MAKDIYEAAKVLRERADDSLVSELVALQERLWKATFDLRRGQLSNTASILKIRRQIARVRSVQSERLHGLSKAPADATAGAPAKAAKAPKKKAAPAGEAAPKKPRAAAAPKATKKTKAPAAKSAE